MIEVLGVKNASKLVPTEDDEVPVDPIQENQNALTGKPLKAFIEQNHEAHIKVHMNAMQDPKIAQIIGQNPQAQTIMAAMMAHINEHVAFEYRVRMQEEMGIQLPTKDQNKKVDEGFANQIAAIAAEASSKLFKQNSDEAKQQQAQQQMQDPVVQMQQQELQIKMQELQLKAQKQQLDAAAKADQLDIEKARIDAQKEIAAMQVAASSASKKDQLEKRQELEGTRLGIQLAQQRNQMRNKK
jgi:hypothetical protein